MKLTNLTAQLLLQTYIQFHYKTRDIDIIRVDMIENGYFGEDTVELLSLLEETLDFLAESDD